MPGALGTRSLQLGVLLQRLTAPLQCKLWLGTLSLREYKGLPTRLGRPCFACACRHRTDGGSSFTSIAL